MLKSKKNATYIIAEVGQNHQGTLISQIYNKVFRKGDRCNKVSKRNNETLFSKQKYDQLYENQNSFGKTYGLHRNHT